MYIVLFSTFAIWLYVRCMMYLSLDLSYVAGFGLFFSFLSLFFYPII